MAIGKLQKIHTDNDEFNRFQDQNIAALAPVLSNPLMSGNFVKGVQLNNAKDNIISHGLGRKYISYVKCAIYNSIGFSDIWISPTVNKSPEKFIIINCMDTMTIDLYFF
jgi:hypothetical protein